MKEKFFPVGYYSTENKEFQGFFKKKSAYTKSCIKKSALSKRALWKLCFEIADIAFLFRIEREVENGSNQRINTKRYDA